MSTLITAEDSQTPLITMWVLVALVVVVALWLSVRMIRRARHARRTVAWSPPKVAASAGTHSGGGAMDVLWPRSDREGSISAGELSVLNNLVIGGRQVYPTPPPPYERTIELAVTPDFSDPEVVRWRYDVDDVDLNRVIGFDREGTPVMVRDLVDDNIDFKDVIRAGVVYG